MRCMTHTVIKNEMFKLNLFILGSLLDKLIPSYLLVPFSHLKSTEELWTYQSKGDQSLFFQILLQHKNPLRNRMCGVALLACGKLLVDICSIPWHRGTFSSDFGHTCVNIRAAAVVIFIWLS